MEFKIQIYKLLCEYRFRPSLLYYDEKNRIGNNLVSDYKHWRTDGSQITLTNFENRSALTISHNRLVLEIDVPDSLDEFLKKFERSFKEYTGKLAIDTYKRLGIRTQSMIPLPFKFGELVQITQERLIPRDEQLLKIVGSELDDYMYNIITNRGDCKLHVICGAVQRNEIPRWYNPAEMTTDAGEHVKEITYSDVSFFIDCDYYVNDPDPGMVKDFLLEGLGTATTIPKEIGEYLFGEH